MKKERKMSRLSRLGIVVIAMAFICSVGLFMCYSDMGFFREARLITTTGLFGGILLGAAIIATLSQSKEASHLSIVLAAAGVLALLALLFGNWSVPELFAVGAAAFLVPVISAVVIYDGIQRKRRADLDAAYQQTTISPEQARR